MTINLKTKTNQDAINLLMKLILLMPITTLFQGYIESINVILFILIFIIEMFVLVKRMTKKYFFLLFATFSGYLITLVTNDVLPTGNMIIYYLHWIIYAVICAINKDKITEWLKNNETYSRGIMIVWTVAVGISIFLPSSYYIKEGGARYFGSFPGDIFRLGPTALFISILAVVSISFYKRKKDILFTILPLFCGFMGSSRTYFLCLVLVFLIGLYFEFKTKKYFYLLCIPIGILGALVFTYSSLNEKIEYTTDSSQYGDFWFRITSSRSVIWSKIIAAFNELDLLKKIFGAGFGFSNSASYHYSHNDFIEVTVTHGYLGMLFYMIALIGLFYLIFKAVRVKKLIYVFCILVWLSNAMFNMFYCYTCTLFSYPILLIAVSHYFEKQPQNPLPDKEESNEKIVNNCSGV